MLKLQDGIMNIICSICSELINQTENIFATVCGHVFHCNCLSEWIKRSQSCPQCREKVTYKGLVKLYVTVSNENSVESPAVLQSALDDAQLQLRQQKAKVKEFEEKFEKVQEDLKKHGEFLKKCEAKLVCRDAAINGLKEQLEYMKVQNYETQRLKSENESLNKNIEMLNGLQKVLNATYDEVEQMLQGYTDVRTVATFATALKKALCESELKKKELRKSLQTLRRHLDTANNICLQKDNAYVELEDKYTILKSKKHKVEKKMRLLERTEVIPISSDESSFKLRDQALPENNVTLATENGHDNASSVVEIIENSDSPYLSLRQGSLALFALHGKPKPAMDRIKPSELMMINSINHSSGSGASKTNSIFHKKDPVRMDSNMEADTIGLLSYDGLGGHSKLDIFPKRVELPTSSHIPKLSAKHKLKRPQVSGSQDVSEMLKRSRDK